ncbi:MAG: PAC2 family protein [Candidatus Woesearchaeota archaeon]
MNWKITNNKNFKIRNPILIEGLPGIGNVGKIVMDILIEKNKAEKFLSFFSYGLPNSVFVNEDNLIELPKIELYYKKINNADFLFLTGDVQPVAEQDSYEFCDIIIDLLKKYQCEYIITLGGIGLNSIPEKPVVYITGNNKEFVGEFLKGLNVNPKIYGVVGPIMGVSGVLLGMAGQRKIKAVSLLAETFGHPVYLGLKGAKEILINIDKKFNFRLDLKELEKEIKNIDDQFKGIEPKKLSKFKPKLQSEVTYIG